MTQEKTIAARKARNNLAERAVSREEFLISKYLGQLQFKPRLWGVDEMEVWRALEKLTELYEDALTTERVRRQLAQRALEAIRSREAEETPHDE